MKRVLLVLLFCLKCFVGSSHGFSDEMYHRIFHEISSNNPQESSFKQLDSLLLTSSLNNFDRARIYNLKGLYHDLLHEPKVAVDQFNRSLKLLGDNDSWRCKVALNLSVTYVADHQFTKAATFLMQVEKRAEEMQDIALQTKVKEYYANLYFRQGDIKKALSQLERVVHSYESMKDTVKMSRLYNNLAVLYRNNSFYQQAIKFNMKSLELSSTKGDRLSVSQSYNNIGLNYEDLYYESNNMDYLQQAVDFYKEATKIKRAFPKVWNSALSNLIRVCRLMEDYEDSDRYFEELSESKRGSYMEVERVLREKMLFDLNCGHSIDAYRSLFRLDSIQRLIRDQQTADFEQMLKNQRDLFVSKKKEKEKALALTKEHNLRLMAENRHNRLKILFLLILIVLLVGGLLFVHYHKSIMHKKEQEKKDLKLTILRSQMNPHFIFNVLTAIQNSLLDDDPLRSAGYIARFSNLIRKNFDFTDKESISLSDDLDALVNYIETQKIRFGDLFDYHIHVGDEVKSDSVMVPPMLLQPLVENAIEHGLKKRKEKGLLRVEVDKKGSKLLFVVVDNGIGYRPSSSDGKKHALDVLKSRLTLPGYGDEKSFYIGLGEAGIGTEIRFLLTLNSDV
ncbi:histidine kinase [Halosquirtibacter laminarini]|uniref:Histidine kinase n=1 Tax=Halosquirtibacter laminarini TaxID=3374600 RepID=A0AC61NHN9_9BACT|nr:histidine kinase [Prolixibacteraceae bacterium]